MQQQLTKPQFEEDEDDEGGGGGTGVTGLRFTDVSTRGSSTADGSGFSGKHILRQMPKMTKLTLLSLVVLFSHPGNLYIDITLTGGGSKRTKVEMQILHLSKDAQDRVEKTLSELYGGQYKLRDARCSNSCS